MAAVKFLLLGAVSLSLTITLIISLWDFPDDVEHEWAIWTTWAVPFIAAFSVTAWAAFRPTSD